MKRKKLLLILLLFYLFSFHLAIMFFLLRINEQQNEMNDGSSWKKKHQNLTKRIKRTIFLFGFAVVFNTIKNDSSILCSIEDSISTPKCLKEEENEKRENNKRRNQSQQYNNKNTALRFIVIHAQHEWENIILWFLLANKME